MIRHLCDGGMEKIRPREHRLSSIGKPYEAKQCDSRGEGPRTVSYSICPNFDSLRLG